MRSISPVPLVIPPRTDSVNALSSSSRSQSYNPSSLKDGSTAPQNYDMPTNTKPLNVLKSNTTETSNNHLAPYPHYNRPNISMELSRESRITLPEEARQYIANMVDSPQQSPKMGKSSIRSSPPLNQNSKPDTRRSNSAPEKSSIDADIISKHSQMVEETEHEIEENENAPRPSISTITSIGTSTTDYSYPYGGNDFNGESESEVEEVSTEDLAFIENNQNHTGTNFDQSKLHSKPRGRTRSGTTADQFPLPPSTLIAPNANITTSISGHNPPSPRTAVPLRSLNTSVSAPVTGNASSPSSYSPNTATASGVHVGIGIATSIATVPSSLNINSSTNNNAVSNKEVDLMPQNDQGKEREGTADRISWLPFREGSKLFRQMPLIDSDLKNTSTRVVGSHIKANEKGKEVLTFAISVDIRGKTGWVVSVMTIPFYV